jgi:hypothetical protein
MADSMRNASESGILDRMLELIDQGLPGHAISEALGLEPELYRESE